jgi:hypothetical protein
MKVDSPNIYFEHEITSTEALEAIKNITTNIEQAEKFRNEDVKKAIIDLLN